jgi:hypothetical protein
MRAAETMVNPERTTFLTLYRDHLISELAEVERRLASCGAPSARRLTPLVQRRSPLEDFAS